MHLHGHGNRKQRRQAGQSSCPRLGHRLAVYPVTRPVPSGLDSDRIPAHLGQSPLDPALGGRLVNAKCPARSPVAFLLVPASD